MKTSTIKRVISADIIRWRAGVPIVRIRYVDGNGKRKQWTTKRGVTISF